MTQSCKTCRYAAFARTPAGRIKSNGRHECTAPLPDLSKVPECVRTREMWRCGIQPTFGGNCGAYESI